MPTIQQVRLTDLKKPDAVTVINNAFDDLSQQLTSLTKQIATPKRISAQPTLNFGTVNAGSSTEVTVNVNGATTSLVATANPLLTLGSPLLTWTAFISGTNEVTVRVANPTGGNLAVNTVRWNILVS